MSPELGIFFVGVGGIEGWDSVPGGFYLKEIQNENKKGKGEVKGKGTGNREEKMKR